MRIADSCDIYKHIISLIISVDSYHICYVMLYYIMLYYIILYYIILYYIIIIMVQQSCALALFRCVLICGVPAGVEGHVCPRRPGHHLRDLVPCVPPARVRGLGEARRQQPHGRDRAAVQVVLA